MVDGKVRYVGYGGHYILGNEENIFRRFQFVSAHVWDSYSSIDDVLCTNRKTCVISEGRVYCIGENIVERKYSGGTTTWGAETLSTPFLIREIENIIAIDGGDDIVCGLRADGAFFCWGNVPFMAGNGQIYDRFTDPPELILGGETNETKVSQFAVAGDAFCYHLSNKKTQCFGRNKWGELGGLLDPTDIGDVAKLVAGPHHFCALLYNGDVYCWGRVGGDDSSAEGTIIYTEPTFVIDDIVEISTSSTGYTSGYASITFARKTNGSLYGWGDNRWSQLGIHDYDTSFRESPIQVHQTTLSSEDIVSYHLTERTAHAILSDGRIAAWGLNWYGTLGDGGESNTFRRRVVTPPVFMNLMEQPTSPPTSRPSRRPSYSPTITPTFSPTSSAVPFVHPSITTPTNIIVESQSRTLTIVISTIVVIFTLLIGGFFYHRQRKRSIQARSGTSNPNREQARRGTSNPNRENLASTRNNQLSIPIHQNQNHGLPAVSPIASLVPVPVPIPIAVPVPVPASEIIYAEAEIVDTL